jgi:DNA-binding NtrC family response regulator
MNDKRSILVVDDEPIVGERLQVTLQRDGFAVDVMVDPRVAMQRLEEKSFDIVVSDIRMGEIDGIEVLEKVLAQSPRTKVIMITGYATLELARESLTRGAFDFIAKPFKLGELRKTIAKAISVLESDEEKARAGLKISWE